MKVLHFIFFLVHLCYSLNIQQYPPASQKLKDYPPCESAAYNAISKVSLNYNYKTIGLNRRHQL
jgi:hypothetical protein